MPLTCCKVCRAWPFRQNKRWICFCTLLWEEEEKEEKEEEEEESLFKADAVNAEEEEEGGREESYEEEKVYSSTHSELGAEHSAHGKPVASCTMLHTIPTGKCAHNAFRAFAACEARANLESYPPYGSTVK